VTVYCHHLFQPDTPETGRGETGPIWRRSPRQTRNLTFFLHFHDFPHRLHRLRRPSHQIPNPLLPFQLHPFPRPQPLHIRLTAMVNLRIPLLRTHPRQPQHNPLQQLHLPQSAYPETLPKQHHLTMAFKVPSEYPCRERAEDVSLGM